MCRILFSITCRTTHHSIQHKSDLRGRQWHISVFYCHSVLRGVTDPSGHQSACHRGVFGSWHLLYVVTSDFSTIRNTRFPLVTCCAHGHSAVGFETVSIPCDTLLETLHAFISNECFRKEIDCADVSCELHGVFP